MTTRWSSARERAVAMLATLHIGIEPVFLVLLVDVGAMPPAAAGWVVGAGQFGMTMGALLCWRMPQAGHRSAALVAALFGTGAGLGLAVGSNLGGVLVLRILLGAVMGLLLARATAASARVHAERAIGFILLGQQLLATFIMVALPIVASRWSATTALILLAAVPLATGLLAHGEDDRHPSSVAAPAPPVDDGKLRLRSVNAAAMALFIACTVMVWSYIGAVGIAAGIPARNAAMAIAAASLASIPAALLASLTAPRHTPPVTAAICGLATLCPLLLPHGGGLTGYIAAMALFNGGSTFAIVRFAGWAMEGSADSRERRMIVLIQCCAAAIGAPLGALAVGFGGMPTLTALVTVSIAAAVLTLLLPWRRLAAARPAPVGAVA